MPEPYASLDHMLDRAVRPERQAFVRALCESVGCSSYVQMSSYVKAERADGGTTLQIFAGYTTGLSEAEAQRLSREWSLPMWASHIPARGHGIDHPLPMGSRTRPVTRPPAPATVCPECHLVRSSSGRCDCD